MGTNKLRRKILLIVLALLVVNFSYSQVNRTYTNSSYFKKAIELYEKEMYRSAQEQLAHARKATDKKDVILLSRIDFYDAMCSLKSDQKNAESLVLSILEATPENPDFAVASYEFAKYLYEKERYKDAYTWFAKTDINAVPAKDIDEYCFKAGYCYYHAGQKEKAIALFRKVKDKRNLYGDASTYYLSHAEYEQGNYTTASNGFERLRNNPIYSSVIPYYTMQIYFIQKDYDKVIDEGKDFMRLASTQRKSEITRLMSEAYLQKGDAANALSVFQEYEKSSSKLTRDDTYLKGYILYKNQKYTDAIKTLKSIDKQSDSTSQNTIYCLADCYLKTNDKDAAKKAFFDASKMNFDQKLLENAAYNYAKLALELDDNEQAINDFISKYPKNSKNDELKTFMASNEAKKGNYSGALDILQSIQNPSPSDLEGMQRIAYAYGLDLFKKEQYAEAIQMFDNSLRYAEYNTNVAALSKYGKADATYNMGDYKKAEVLFNDFINTSGAFKSSEEYKIAHYNIGYCYFKQHNYDEALRWFRKYISFESSSSVKTAYLGDAYNRVGDCYYKKRNFAQAVDNYTRAESLKLSNPDYAAYQRAMSIGFTANRNDKIKALEKALSAYPKSNYVPASLYEIGRTYVQASKYNEATSTFEKIVNQHKSSPFYPKALVELGLININNNNSEKALMYYHQVVEKAPDAPEAKDALEGIKNIYIDQNRMDEYFAYVNRIGQTVKSTTEKDSLVFIAAEKQYQSGNCESALTAIKRYLNEFPTGENRTAANFYLADCALKKGDDNEALKAYTYVVNQPSSDFSEMAWFGYAKANLNLNNYTKAIEGFEKLKQLTQTPSVQLDAEVGLMRAYFMAERYDKAAISALRVATSKNIPAELAEEAVYTHARSLQLTHNYKEAIEQYHKLTKDYKKALDAEAKFHIIECLFAQDKLKEVETEVYSFADNKAAQPYWLAKSFIVLGDVYVQKKDFFQAKATYKSIIDGYPRTDDGVKEEATKRYALIQDK